MKNTNNNNKHKTLLPYCSVKVETLEGTTTIGFNLCLCCHETILTITHKSTPLTPQQKKLLLQTLEHYKHIEQQHQDNTTTMQFIRSLIPQHTQQLN